MTNALTYGIKSHKDRRYKQLGFTIVDPICFLLPNVYCFLYLFRIYSEDIPYLLSEVNEARSIYQATRCQKSYPFLSRLTRQFSTSNSPHTLSVSSKIDRHPRFLSRLSANQLQLSQSLIKQNHGR